MGSKVFTRALVLWAGVSACAAGLAPAPPAEDDDCALYLTGPGRSSAYDYTLNLLKGNFGYEGQHTCITYDAVNQAYLEARNRIVVSQPKGDWKAEDFASAGELILDISINLARRYGLTYEEVEKGLPLIDTSRTLIRDICPPVFSHVECRAGKYRRLDGLCNNLQNPTWGATMAPFQRLIGPLFADGINAPRIAHTGRDLPLSRVVSRTMHPDEGYHDHAGTVMVIAWGQFMDHDYTLTGTPLDPINRNDPEECCKRPPHLKHPYCNEIRIPDDDYFYRLWNVKCIDFVRAFPSPRPGCRLGSRVPFNTLTGVIDGNTVYGVTDKFSRKLRTGYGGLLRMNPVFKEYGLKDLLPLKLDIPDEGCTRPNKNMYCFEGGEIRVNEQLVLTVMHTLMAREHNRIAEGLAAVNPHWDDETLFQEARRINVAEIQHITYNEFLPILLGKDVMEKFGLVLEKEGYWDGYDQNVNPNVIDAFASAAFRFGHSLLPTAVERWSKAHKFIASKRLSDLIRRPYDLYRAGVLDEYVMGLMNQVAQAMDDSITQEVTNHLFKKVGARFGMDLVSFNMQRGREFGIPGYMEFRKFCGLGGADSFQDLFGSMPNETVRKYETIFEHPIDVDLWSGGVSERPLPGSMLGPTFACVIATQFSYSRRGDRFWFELPNQPSSFTPEQLHEIRKSRLARVICDNTDIIDTVQLYPMVLPDHELNPRVPCRSGIIPSMDFSKWAEPAPFHGGPKPFVTDAHIIEKNITESENQIEKSAEDNTITISLNKTVAIELNKDQDNPENVQEIKCENGQNSTQNCTENAPTKLKEGQGSDTVLKYVYKKDDKINLPKKSSGHPTNSLKRRKRSINNTEDVIHAATAPLIVNYETSHGPHVGTFARNTASLIRNANLADFNIKTLHDNQPIKNNNERRENTEKSDEDDSRSKSQEDESSNERDSNRYDDKKPKQYTDNDDSGEVPQNIETLDDDSRSKEQYKDGHGSGEQNLDIDGTYKEDRGNNDLFKDSRESGERNHERGDYRDDEKRSSRYKDNRGSEERDHEQDGDYRDDRESSERYKDNRDSGERNHDRDGEYKNDKESSERYIDNRDSRERERNNERDGEYRNNRESSERYKDDRDSRERNRERDGDYRNDRGSNERYKNNRDSGERGEYRTRDSTLRIIEDSNDDYRKSPYKENNHSDGRSEYREKEPEESRENIKNKRKFKGPYPERNHHNDFKLTENDSQSQEKVDSLEKDYPQEDKTPYSIPPKDSNESREQSEELSYPKQESRENFTSEDDSSSTYTKPSDDNSESIEKEEYRKTHHTAPEESDESQSYKSKDKSHVQPPENNETEQEEAIIAIMKRKKLHNKPIDHNQNQYKDEVEKIVPVKIKDVDLADFSYETVHVNDKGLVEPVKDTHEDYEAAPSIAPLTTFKPATVKKNSEVKKTLDVIQIPSIKIDDVDLRPVIEINTDKDDEESKEALKANNEDTSLETLLGIKDLNSDEKSDKIVEQPDEQIKSDVKQEFERIPLNYNHAKKEKEQKEKPVDEDTPPSTTPATNDEDDEKVNQGTVDTFAPKDVTYDEHLNLKFSDVTVKLPEIKLPEDILAYAYGDPPYEEKEKNEKKKDREPKKEKFFRYDEHEYNEENPSGSLRKKTHDHDDHDHDHEDNKDHGHHHDNFDDYYGYYGKDKKKDDYKKKAELEDDDDEEEDLYEKFVRERFGKRRTFHKRSEALTEPKPEQENEKLFKTLENVLLKAKNLEKESEKSGDPNAAYMWTVEYGRPL